MLFTIKHTLLCSTFCRAYSPRTLVVASPTSSARISTPLAALSLLPHTGAMMGHSSVSMTGDLDLHARLRQYLGQAFTKEAVQQMLPQLQSTAAAHMARWAGATSISTTTASISSSGSSAGPAPPVGLATTADGSMVVGYPAVRLLTFDVLVNQALGLRMTDAEVQQYAELFETLVDGFVPPAWDLPFTPYGKGLKAR